MKKFLLALLAVIFSNVAIAQNQPNDCVNAITVCGNGTFSSNASGIGAVQEVSGCGGAEHNSIWLKINVVQAGTLGFNIIPNDTNIVVDYDFWVYGPNRTCSNLGSPIRCATTNPQLAGMTNNHTGMNGATTLTQTGPGANGNGYVRWLNVTPGQSYYIAIDRPEGDGGFDLEWTGTATLNGGAFAPPPVANTIADLKVCSATPNIGLFDLNSVRSQINPDLANNTITFHTTLANANDGIAPLPNIIANTVNPQTIYARVTNTTSGCYSITDFKLIVYPVPTANLSVAPTAICAGENATVTFTGTPDGTIEYTINGGAVQTAVLNAAGTFTLTQTLTADTTYTLSYIKIIDNNGTMLCSQALNASVTVTVSPLPVATISGTATICSGDAATITFNGTPNATVTYTFNGGANQQIVLDAAGTATLTGGTAGTYNLVSAATTGTPACSQPQTGSVTITTTSLPTAAITGTAPVCSGTTATITFSGTPGATVTYTVDANPNEFITLNGTGTATVTTPVLTNSSTYTLVAVASAGTPSCSQPLTAAHTVNVIQAPVINTPAAFEVCSNNSTNAFAVFDLTTRINEITGGYTAYTVTFHETQADANAGTNPKGPLYTNINPVTQTLYVRVVSGGANQCASFTTLLLKVIARPALNPDVTNYEVCETSVPGDGFEIFDLTVKNTQLINGQTGVSVSYYISQADAQSGTAPIVPATAFPNTGNPQTIWYQLRNTTGCISVGSFQLIVNPSPVITPLNPMNACSNGTTTTAAFDLALNNPLVTGGVAGLQVSYHLTQGDANTGLNPLPIPYTSGPATIFVRVKNPVTGCFATTTLELNITQGPLAVTPQPLEYCDPNNDGFGPFDLNGVAAVIAGGTIPPGVSVTFHETPEDAQLELNALQSPYTNINPWTQTLYVNVSYTLTSCTNTVQLQLIVHETPEAVTPTPLVICDDNTADGFAAFDLTVKASEILGTLNPANHTLSYHVNLNDAQAGINIINNIFSYTNITNPQVIYVRVTHNTTGCFDVVSLKLIVNPLPVVPMPVPAYSLCDYTGLPLYEEFDLSTKIPEIIGTTTGLNVTFYF
ncbi:MAG: hypothetical protein J0I85_05735, partial [Flavobacterium sp.]|nr:hypothetical protein [Flavobacterium sp.]